MVIVKLMGGLGNQLFQYAFARAVAEVLGCDFKFDISSYQVDNLRKLELETFIPNLPVATEDEIKALKIKTKVPKFLRKILKVEKFDPKSYFGEKEFVFYHAVFEKNLPMYFEGFWQSEKYFKQIETLIREGFAFETLGFVENTQLLEQIQNSNSVAFHIRRGDYVKNPKAKAIYDVITLQYYQRAIEYIKNNVENPVFCIFSDDIEWVKSNLDIENALYSTGKNHFEDFCFMQNCKHSIIANSSFSWWAAWLNPNHDKIVIAPGKWFSDKSKIKYHDIVPETWVKLEV